MEAPIYHLEQVLRSKQEEAEDFVGPLDLILHLLSKNKIEIKDIPVAQILDQYLNWMSKRKELDLEIASDFIAMAAHLLYIKTRMLLSTQDEEALSEVELLIADLELHQRQETHTRILLGLAELERLHQQASGYLSTPRKRLDGTSEKQLCQHLPQDLSLAMERILLRHRKRLPPPLRAFQALFESKPYPVEQKALELRERLNKSARLPLDELLRESESRSELVAIFIVVLELCKSGLLLIAQERDELLLIATPEGFDFVEGKAGKEHALDGATC